MRRRSCLLTLLSAGFSFGQQWPGSDTSENWVCPMDPGVRSSKGGACPRCGMALVMHIPERVEYPISIRHTPDVLQPGSTATLIFRVLDPATNQPVRRFDVVHEKLIHIFLVSENLEFFAHVHPTTEPDGSFKLKQRLPLPGMYRVLADFYPSGSVPQLAADTLFVAGASTPSRISPSLSPCKSENLTAHLDTGAAELIAGLEQKLVFKLDPPTGLEPYLGAWGHMLVASEDLVDMLHVHPFLTQGSASVQFNVIFPRPGLYRIWTQFQRQGTVNTVEFTVPVKAV